MEYQIAKSEEVGQAVVRGVSDFEDCDPDELEPLYETIEVEALNKLFSRDRDANHSISFSYSDSYIAIEGRQITISDVSEPMS